LVFYVAYIKFSSLNQLTWYIVLLVIQGSAIAFYILSSLLFNYFAIHFVITVLLEALDFWVVKNVSGRILVGLRWWNEVTEQGESIWRYESLPQEVKPSE
jgi:hypothetical protein